MRNAFIDELVQLARQHPAIALIVGDLGYSVIEPFAEEFPERFINAGVAEQNMMGLAAGMASEGYHVFVYSIANFPTFRCAEQIRNDVAYHNLPVTIVAVGGGLSYGALGYSHHAVQDYALIRAMPNMLIASPGDPLEVRGCLRYLINNPQPSYLRLNKAGEALLHKEVPILSPGKWKLIHAGNDDSTRAHLATGYALQIAHRRLKKNSEYSHDYLFSMPLWGMECKKYQVEQVKLFDDVKVYEDHLRDGGFSSWMLESLLDAPNFLKRISSYALDPVVCGAVGSQDVMNKLGGLIE
ncbi:transketolase [Polynucleobacter sp. TSB-Sco08W16]|uniref:transketolase family protein n=1 Tax=Polynucleobacter sp. TSB-Sco08W16 TaxID=1758374 RepID=UPI001BFCE254|nr:transketolase [Polynucleobacter sp. TSB-Sco08W16]QWD74556.1 transketolase [Polynucleobacter sp. TSB-Sco08W16]